MSVDVVEDAVDNETKVFGLLVRFGRPFEDPSHVFLVEGLIQPVVETGLDTAEGDGGGGGDDDVGGGRAHGADARSNARYLARRDKY